MSTNKKLYSFRRFKFWYRYLFELEKRRLLKILPSAKIEHIGSTSIPGLGGKGVIDLLVGFSDKDWKKNKNILLKEKYKFYHEVSNCGRLFFRKIRGRVFKITTHIQMVKVGNSSWKETLNFKENLLKNPKLVKEYSTLKKEAVKVAKGEGRVYRKLKNKFIRKYSK